MDHNQPASSVQGIYWSGLPFSSPGVSSSPRDGTRFSCIGKWILYHWATRELQANTLITCVPSTVVKESYLLMKLWEISQKIYNKAHEYQLCLLFIRSVIQSVFCVFRKLHMWFPRALLVAQMVKNLPAMQETWVWSLGQEDPLNWLSSPWRRELLPIPVCLPGKSHRQKSLAGYSSWVCRGRQD